MPITMELRENDRVLYYEISDPWSLSDLMALYDQNKVIRDQHQAPIHAIANLTAARHLPQGIMGVRSYSPDVMHPRARHVVMAAPHALGKSIGETVCRLLRSLKRHVLAPQRRASTNIPERMPRHAHA